MKVLNRGRFSLWRMRSFGAKESSQQRRHACRMWLQGHASYVNCSRVLSRQSTFGGLTMMERGCCFDS